LAPFAAVSDFFRISSHFCLDSKRALRYKSSFSRVGFHGSFAVTAKGVKMRKVGLLAVAALLLMAGAYSAVAAGPNVYPDGAEGFWVGAAPPPGFYYVNYDLWYSTGSPTTAAMPSTAA
jgi:hypothetical protein